MKIILAVISLIMAGFLLFEPKIAASAVGAAISDCLEIIVPSLFAFTTLAIFLQKSGLYRVALKPLTFPLSKLLRLDEELCAVFVLANIGGYPVGVKLLSELKKQGRISADDAARMMCCCFGSGPGFIVGIVGVNVFESATAGLMLFGACFAGSLVIAAAVRARGEIALKPAETRFSLDSTSFTDSIVTAAKTLFTICAMIVGFSVVTAFLRTVGINALFEKLFGNSAIFPSLLEVTRIKEMPFSPAAMSICAALLSFGGVCVLLQIKALSNGVPLRKFVISRAAAAAISAIIALPLSTMLEAPGGAVSAVVSPIAPFSVNAVLSVCVLAMCGILLAETHKN
ncbi:MAG: hypothetical protein K2N06_00205 [Oscillospiraceae bacterium]|nr:hypothetical protein [Oscillospiraceae bacterium]